MRRGFLVPLTIILFILGMGHRYLWLRLVAAPGLEAPWRTIATVAIIALYVLIPVPLLVTRRMSRAAGAPFAWIAYSWMGFGLYLLLGTAASDLVRLGFAIAGAARPDPGIVALCVVGAAAAVTLYGVLNVARPPVVRRVRVPIAKLPAELDGYTIAQLTDVHIGSTLGRRFSESIVRVTNALAPDLVAVTGDLVDGTVEVLRPHVAPLAGLRARDGVYYCTGNHEYYSGADPWLAHVRTLGWKTLRNEHVTIRGGLQLAGVDDTVAAGMLPGHGEDVPGALAGCDPALPIVLLAHHPRTIERAEPAGVDLQLSGHVHGGQMFPMWWVAKLREPYINGLFRVGKAWLYVSEGTGYWGPPVRVGTTCEITLLTLVRASLPG